jgi:excisionase family DNA binding protein
VKKMLHSVSDACALLGIGRTTLYELIKNGDLEATKVGRRTLLTTASLEAFIESRPKMGGTANDDVTLRGGARDDRK